MRKHLGFLLLLFLVFTSCKNQEDKNKTQEPKVPAIPFEHLSLKSISDFRYSSDHHDNWSVAGTVYANRNIVHSLQTSPGTGILVSKPTDTDRAELLTKFKHGDIDLELDFMMPKGSNSGIYFMGRYEVQIFDSWLKPNDSLQYGDCGGIYERMAHGQGFEGQAPAINACKAPGLWQHLKVRFQAPRFDASGKKISNAKFVYVYLNGALVQKNVEASLPTLGSYFSDEQPLGPLEIQGSHGPVAYKNIKYRTYIPQRIALKDMTLKVYKSLYTNLDTLQRIKPVRIFRPDSLSQLSYNKYEQGVYKGTMSIPADGEYIFKLQAGGPSWLWIDSQLVVDNDTSGDYFTPHYEKVHLDQGNHLFALVYNNRYQQFKLSYQATHIPETLLSTPSSAFPKPAPAPYIVEVADKAVTQRGFMMHDGEKLTHVIAVGLPGGINYAYNLNNYNIISVWRGGFIDAADMWRSRGEEQLALPLGGITVLGGKPTVQMMQHKGDEWPRNIPADSGVFRNRSYRLTDKGMPLFAYTYKNITVNDYIHPVDNSKGLQRELTLTFNNATENLCVLLAEGALIDKLPDSSYAVDNYNYYLTDLAGARPEVVKVENGYRLVAALKPQGNVARIKYNIIW